MSTEEENYLIDYFSFINNRFTLYQVSSSNLSLCQIQASSPSQIKLKYLSEEDWLALTHRVGKDRKYQADLAKTTSLNDNKKACRKG